MTSYAYSYYTSSKDGLLYPHDVENIVVIAPNQIIEEINVIKILIKSSLVNVWIMAILLVVITRCFIKKILKTNTTWQRIIFEAYAISFHATSLVRNYKNWPDKIVGIFLSIFSLIAGNFCASYLLRKLTLVSFDSKINTFHDLVKSKMNVYVPQEYINDYTNRLIDRK